MAGTVKSLVLTGYGINSEVETAYANTLAGAEARIAHINDVIDGIVKVEDYHLINFPGGFSYGDDLGSGKAFANKVLYAKTPSGLLIDQIQKFIDDGRLIIGICNGFQILVKMGLLPGFARDYSKQTATVFYNDKGFRDAWVRLKVNTASQCVFTRDIGRIDMPIRHGEGKFIPGSPEILSQLWKNGHVALQYADAGYQPTQQYPDNPNGSTDAIAGICDETGRIFGLMPHPEAFNHISNHPQYTRIREECSRKGVILNEEGDGIKIWRNAVDYIEANLL